MAKAKSAVPAGFHTLTPHLIVDNAHEAIEWYKRALGADEVAPRALGPDGKVMHAESASATRSSCSTTRWAGVAVQKR